MPLAVRLRAFLPVICLSLAPLAPPLAAQEFRLYTSVTDQSTGSRGKSISTSLTLFHAGKVYDYLEQLEETVIHEPAHNRFSVLSRRHNLATEISQDEVRRFLGLARANAREWIDDAKKQGPKHEAAIGALEFQLIPQFEVRDDAKAKKLTLTSPFLSYDVVYAAPPTPDIAQAYLKSADWTAQLNSVLHPHALLPEARMRLNDELRQRNVIPEVVELRIAGEHPVHLKARHEWRWKLIATDRQFIEVRESQLRKQEFRLVPFQDFQQETLIVAGRKR